jgi:hypothetical protein
LHGMVYYIFSKSLRILEEFRKNPHIKIPPKSPCTKFQSLYKFKNLIFNSKGDFPPSFRPSRPTRPFGLPGPADFLPPPASKQSRQPLLPAGLTSPPWPPPLKGKKSPRRPSFISTLNGPPPLHSSGNLCLQARTLKLLLRWPLKTPQTLFSPLPYKRHPHPR